MLSFKSLPREEAVQTALYVVPPVELPSVSLAFPFSTFLNTCTRRVMHYKGAF